MKSQIIDLYPALEIQKLTRKAKLWQIALSVIALTALTACIVLTALTTTANAQQMELAVIIISTVAGWLIIYFGTFAALAGKRELTHADMLNKEERIRIAGAPTVTDRRITIRHSITARRIEVQTEGETRRLLVCESKARELEAANAVALYAAHGYVAAYEVVQ